MDMLQRGLITTVCVVTFFYFLVRRSLTHWKRRGILHEKPAFPWGNLKGVGKKRHVAVALQNIYEKFKESDAPFVGFYAFIKPMVLVVKLDLVQHILETDFKYFASRGHYQNVQKEPLTGNLMQLDGDDWQVMRSNLKSCCFDGKDLSYIWPTLQHVAFGYKRALSQQRHPNASNINELVNEFNVNAVAALAFGFEGAASTEFRRMCNQYQRKRSIWKEFLALRYPRIARFVCYRSIDDSVTKYFVNLIRERLDERARQMQWNSDAPPPQQDYLQLFSQLSGGADGGSCSCSAPFSLNDDQIAAHCFSFVLAGLEACNATMSFCLYELAVHPELQLRLRKEIHDVLGRNKGDISAATIKQMQYLDQVICETLRLHSPYSFLLRTTTQDYDLRDSVFMLKSGNQVIIPIAAIHHDPLQFPNPERFDPDRFQRHLVQQRHAMAWLPFGHGPRNCIALQLAKLQIAVGLVTILRDYTFQPCTETNLPISYDQKRLLLCPKPDIKLMMQREQ